MHNCHSKLPKFDIYVDTLLPYTFVFSHGIRYKNETCVLFLYMGIINRQFNIENSEIQAFPAPIRFLHRNAMSIFEI